MTSNHSEVITLITCESCYEFVIEPESLEIKGQSYCYACVAGMEVQP